ncbi:MAG: hypothetical protein H8E66_10675 [Planctomycetes bacterium]|nr:hypothetical protein [Planctomycetota bacterium]
MNRCLPILLCVLAALAARNAMAGMPGALPEDFAQVFRLNDNVQHRLQSISFFAFVFFFATGAFWLLWNNLAGSFSRLPRLSPLRAACLTLFLGSLFVVVLTMISGARELLTPGAWNKKGLTYTVAPPDAASESDIDGVTSDAGLSEVLP